MTEFQAASRVDDGIPPAPPLPPGVEPALPSSLTRPGLGGQGSGWALFPMTWLSAASQISKHSWVGLVGLRRSPVLCVNVIV